MRDLVSQFRMRGWAFALLVLIVPPSVLAGERHSLAGERRSSAHFDWIEVEGKLHAFDQKNAVIILPSGERVLVPVVTIPKEQRHSGKTVTVHITDPQQAADFFTHRTSRRPASL